MLDCPKIWQEWLKCITSNSHNFKKACIGSTISSQFSSSISILVFVFLIWMMIAIKDNKSSLLNKFQNDVHALTLHSYQCRHMKHETMTNIEKGRV